MSVAPIEYGEDSTDISVTDTQYAVALRDQQLSRGRVLRLVPNDPEEAPLEVSVTPVGVAERSELMAQLALRLLEFVLHSTRGKKDVQRILASAWPWAEHLPEHDAIAMVDELEELLRRYPPGQDRDAAARQLLIEWEHTAEIFADPELRERLRGPLTLDGPEIPRPGDEEGRAR